MQYPTTSKGRASLVFFKATCLLLAVCFLIFFNSDTWARPRAFLEAWLMEPGAPVAIGETKLIPVHVSVAPKWQSAFIQFEVDTRFPELPEGVNHASVQSEKFEIDASLKAPFTVYVPVKVTGEGLFQMKGILHFDMPEGKTTVNGLSSLARCFSAEELIVLFIKKLIAIYN